MRIVAGSRKGHRIAAPKGTATRPTGDRVREAAFNLIGPLDGAAVLDLYAGSGAMGLEALSRGAAHVTFVDSDRDARRAIDANLDALRLEGARVVGLDALRFLAADDGSYDLILVDPPYAQVEQLEQPLGAHLPRLLTDGGLVVVESGARRQPSLPLTLRTSRRYGSVRLTLFEP